MSDLAFLQIVNEEDFTCFHDLDHCILRRASIHWCYWLTSDNSNAVRLLIFLIFTSLVFGSCSKDNNVEPFENKWKERLSGSWSLVDGQIWWDISPDDPDYRCSRGHFIGNRLVTDNGIGNMVSKFDLDFHLDDSYSLSYSIPLKPVYLTCGNEVDFEFEPPDRIEVLKGSDQGIYYLGVIPASPKHFTIETLWKISLKPSIGETYFTSSMHYGKNLSMRLVNFEEHFTVDIRLVRNTD